MNKENKNIGDYLVLIMIVIFSISGIIYNIGVFGAINSGGNITQDIINVALLFGASCSLMVFSIYTLAFYKFLKQGAKNEKRKKRSNHN